MHEDLGGSSTKFENLNHSKFHAWRQETLAIFALRGLEEFTENDLPTDKAELAEWEKSDRKTRAIIGLSLSDEHLAHVSDVSTGKEMWEAIMIVFEQHNLLNKLSARRKFHTVTVEKGDKY